MLPGGCWTSQPRARSRSSELLEDTHTHMVQNGRKWLCTHSPLCDTLPKARLYYMGRVVSLDLRVM